MKLEHGFTLDLKPPEHFQKSATYNIIGVCIWYPSCQSAVQTVLQHAFWGGEKIVPGADIEPRAP